VLGVAADDKVAVTVVEAAMTTSLTAVIQNNAAEVADTTVSAALKC
jgi:hypothetical protein